MMPEDIEATIRELEAMTAQADATLAAEGQDVPAALVSDLAVSETQARATVDACLGAMKAFHGSEAGFVAAPAVAWGGLETAAHTLNALPPLIAAEGAAELHAALQRIDCHDGVVSLALSARASDGDHHQLTFELRDGALARAAWTGGAQGSIHDAIIVARTGGEFTVTLPRERRERYSVGQAGNVEDASHEALTERGELTTREGIRKLTGEYHEFTPEPGYEIGVDPEEEAARDAEMEQQRTTFSANSRRLTAGLATAVMGMARRSVRAAERKRRAEENRSADTASKSRRKCPYCGEQLRPKHGFCTKCGRDVAPPTEADRQAAARAAAARAAAAKQPPAKPRADPKPTVERPTPPPVECPQCGTHPKPGRKFCHRCGAELPSPAPAGPAPERRTVTAGPPPPPPDPGRASREYARAARQAAQQPRQPDGATPEAEDRPPPPLPEAQPPWEFQRSTTDFARQAVQSLGAKGMIARMIRGALLDVNIYRETAADPKLQSEAWGVMLIAILLSSAGFLLLRFSPNAIMGIISIGVAQTALWLLRVWIIQIIAAQWFKSSASFEQLFRPLAYAQTPACLQIVPLIGQLSRLWTLVTSTAAIRDVTGGDTVKAIVLALAGEIGVGIAAGFVNTFVRGIF